MIREGVELGIALGKGLQNEAWLDKRATFRLQRAEPFQAGTERTMRRRSMRVATVRAAVVCLLASFAANLQSGGILCLRDDGKAVGTHAGDAAFAKPDGVSGRSVAHHSARRQLALGHEVPTLRRCPDAWSRVGEVGHVACVLFGRCWEFGM